MTATSRLSIAPRPRTALEEQLTSRWASWTRLTAPGKPAKTSYLMWEMSQVQHLGSLRLATPCKCPPRRIASHLRPPSTTTAPPHHNIPTVCSSVTLWKSPSSLPHALATRRITPTTSLQQAADSHRQLEVAEGGQCLWCVGPHDRSLRTCLKTTCNRTTMPHDGQNTFARRGQARGRERRTRTKTASS
jgi:hypothetical protein